MVGIAAESPMVFSCFRGVTDTSARVPDRECMKEREKAKQTDRQSKSR